MSAVNRRLLGVIAVSAALLGGCQPSEPQTPAATDSASTTESALVPKAGDLVFELKATEADMRTQVGTRDATGLVATGKKGVLAFGPYWKLTQGHYLLTLEGTTNMPLTLDVVSAQARDTHGKKEVLPSQDATPLASLPFDLTKPVNDLEIRVLAPEGANTRLISYKIVRR